MRKDSIKHWLVTNANSAKALWTLNAITFAESSFFPIPPDPFLAALTVVRPKKWLVFGLNVTIFSVLGGIFGYFIGYAFFEVAGGLLVELYGLHEELQQLEVIFANHSFLATFIAAFTPIPYKIFTISAGLFKVNLISFILASLLGRGIRFIALAAIMRYVGEKYGKTIFKYFNVFLTVFILVVLIYALVF